MLHLRQWGGDGLHELFSLSPIKNITHEVMRGAIMPCLNFFVSFFFMPVMQGMKKKERQEPAVSKYTYNN
jgi:hypothetical protein